MKKMPLIFIGHGSPMNAIEDNIYTKSWKEIGSTLSNPRAILILSAHWITHWEIRISTNEIPGMIYDMWGFPSELYQMKYPARWSSNIAREIRNLLEKNAFSVQEDPLRWLDHGVWSTLLHLFPDANIPVISLSLDYSLSPKSLFHLGANLSILRDQWILIIGSGNIVHNLSAIDWTSKNIFPWAVEFDSRVSSGIHLWKNSKEFMDILDFSSWGDISKLAHPTYDHLIPLFPLLGAVDRDDRVSFFTPEISMGSLSMRSIVWES